jgi:hypothetical protein
MGFIEIRPMLISVKLAASGITLHVNPHLIIISKVLSEISYIYLEGILYL